MAASLIASAAGAAGGLELTVLRADQAVPVESADALTARVAIQLREGFTAADLVAAFESEADEAGALGLVVAELRRHGALRVESVFTPAPRNQALSRRLGLERYAVAQLEAGTDPAALGRALSTIERVIKVAEAESLGGAHTVPSVNDPLFGSSWHLENLGQVVFGVPGVGGADVRARRGWAVARTVASEPATVAVLDTGVSLSHPDLAGVLLPGRSFMSPTFPEAYDDATSISHGTYCAGIVAAMADNGIGVAGAAPTARILPVRVLASNRTGTQTTCASAVIWASDQGADVITMSLGWGAPSSTGVLGAALAYAAASGVVLCSSVGNTPGGEIGYPASDPLVIGVGGTDNRDGPFSGGTTGAAVSLSAPAVGVMTTTDDSAAGLNGYAALDGTSMACPIVAGAAALVRSINPALTAGEVRAILQTTADDLGSPGRDPVFGFGRVNFEAAARAAVASLPCRADADGSAGLTIADLTQMLSWYFAGDPRADIDASLTISVDDIFLFLRMWFAGCSVGP